MSGATSPRKLLWMLEYSIGHYNRLEPLYAFSREDAERQGRHIVANRTDQAVYIGVRAYPNGFVVKYRKLPGSLPEGAEMED